MGEETSVHRTLIQWAAVSVYAKYRSDTYGVFNFVGVRFSDFLGRVEKKKIKTILSARAQHIYETEEFRETLGTVSNISELLSTSS